MHKYLLIALGLAAVGALSACDRRSPPSTNKPPSSPSKPQVTTDTAPPATADNAGSGPLPFKATQAQLDQVESAIEPKPDSDSLTFSTTDLLKVGEDLYVAVSTLSAPSEELADEATYGEVLIDYLTLNQDGNFSPAPVRHHTEIQGNPMGQASYKVGFTRGSWGLKVDSGSTIQGVDRNSTDYYVLSDDGARKDKMRSRQANPEQC